jgi:hypothetical protein
MFERVYHHPLHNPGLFWLVGVPLLVFFARQLERGPEGEMRFFGRYAVGFQLAILSDAALQGELSPLGGVTATASAIVFVVLGDLRFFILLERFGFRRRHAWWTAAALALIVPIGSTLLRPLLPAEPRYLFLAYELMFAALALTLRLGVLPRCDGPHGDWLRSLTGFVLVQYALWALADALILTGIDSGYLLRVVPNAMYYAGFLPFAWFSAPRSLRP